MSLWRIAWRSIQQRALASALTAFSMGLGVALVVAVLVIYGVVDQSFRRGSQGYDLIVGAKGDRLQLVLNTVFHVSRPPQNIPYSYYLEFTQGRFVPAVETAIPVCTGHDYRGCAAVATVPEFFEELTYLDGRKYRIADPGRNLKSENYFEAVIGSTAARKTGLKLGDTFRPVATGLGDAPEHGHQEDEFKVVGILEPTGTPNDGTLFMNIEGFWRCPAHREGPSVSERILSSHVEQQSRTSHEHTVHDGHQPAEHDHDHPETLSDEQKEITAILVCTYDPVSHPELASLAMQLPDTVNNEPVAQAVRPAVIIAEFFDKVVGNIQLILLVLAVLVVVVAGIGILVSIYNSMSDRRHEIAVMRALGAGRTTVMAVILVESILLSLGGGVIGLVLGHGLIGLLGPTIAEQTGVTVTALQFQWVELILVPGLIVLATLVGYLPAVSAYRTDVARSLGAAA